MTDRAPVPDDDDDERGRGPAPFVLGVTTTALGSLGAAPGSDWAGWEADRRAPASAQGNDTATRFREDAVLLGEAGIGHVRVVVDWARVQPRSGSFDGGALEAERERIDALVDAGITPWVALHHLSLPGWFVDDGGFGDDRTRTRHWPRFVDTIAELVGDRVGGWFPVIDPVGWAAHGQLWGMAPPGRRDPEAFAKALRSAWFAWGDAWRQLRGPKPVVTAVQLGPVKAADGTLPNLQRAREWDATTWGTLVAALRDGMIDIPGLPLVEVPGLRDSADVVGVIYRGGVQFADEGRPAPWPPGEPQPWREGLVETMHRLAEMLPDRPLMIAEHGVSTADDDRREELLRVTGDQLRTLRADGVPLVGYFHRCAIDGYETGGGFTSTWGLFDRDRNARPSAQAFRALDPNR